MKIIKPGHIYQPELYDTPIKYDNMIYFMERYGEKYPGNKETQSGTNCQELMRILINRISYLNNQEECFENIECIAKQQICIELFEQRAAKRHGLNLNKFNFIETNIEDLPTCKICGHIICNHTKDKT
jgi:hypothetical protein